MARPTLSVIVVTYQREQILCDTLAHLLELKYPRWELLVVDQTPEHTPSTAEFLRGVSARVRYIRIEEEGICHASNVGVEAAQGEIALFCDDDIVPDPALLYVHARHYKDRSVGGVTGPIHLKPTIAGAPKRIALGGEIRRAPFPATTVDTDCAYGGNVSYLKEVLVSVGGFDEQFIVRAHHQETDLSLRIRGLGYRLLYDPDAKIEHLAVSTGGSRAYIDQEEHYSYGWYHNNAYFFGKHMPTWQLPIFLRFQLGNLIYREAWQKRRTHVIRPALVGLTDGFRLGRKARGEMHAQLAQAKG